MNRVVWVTIRSAIVLLFLDVTTVLAEDYVINWHTIDGGGVGVSEASAGGNYTLSGTIGQPDARNHPAPMFGGSYMLTGGFWVIPECPAIPFDFDGDCDVDEADFAIFAACVSGPAVPYDPNDLPPGCTLVPDGEGIIAADFDRDGDVDQTDFGIFQRCFSGEGNPADPNCANLN